MSEIITCPQCDRSLRVPEELLGKQVKCPSCAQTFTAGGERSSAPAGEERPTSEAVRSRQNDIGYEEDVAAEDALAERKPRRYDAEFSRDDEGYGRGRGVPGGPGDWARVRTGVGLVLAFLLALVLFVVVSMVAGMVMAATNAAVMRPGMAPAAPVTQNQTVTVVMGFFYAAAMALGVAGYWFCMAAPPKQRAKGLATTAFILGIAGVLLCLVCYSMMAFEAPLVVNPANPAQVLENMRVSNYIGFVAGFFELAAFLVFLFFLRAAAGVLGAKGLAGSTKALAIVGLVFFAGYLVMMGLVVAFLETMPAGFGGGAPPPAGLPAGFGGVLFAMAGCGCVECLLALAVFVWSIVSIVQLRTVLSDHLVG